VALRRRVPIEPGQSVLVLGATGNAGTMAVQVAKRLGAGRVVGAGRDVTRLNALIPLGADDVVQITDDSEETARMLGEATAEVDIVIDYLWGKPALSRSRRMPDLWPMSRMSGPNQTSRANELCSCHRSRAVKSNSEIEHGAPGGDRRALRGATRVDRVNRRGPLVVAVPSISGRLS